MLEVPAALVEFSQALGVGAPEPWGAIEGRHGEISCAPGGGFHISVYGYTPHGQERAIYAFAGFARLVEIGADGERLFIMHSLPNEKAAEIIRRWLWI